jgi:molybdenum cofactor cytidylyltransferase
VIDSGSTESSHIHVVVLAAGGSSRFGSPKQLVRVNGRPLMHTVVSRAVELAGHSVTVVLGANAAELPDSVATLPPRAPSSSR